MHYQLNKLDDVQSMSCSGVIVDRMLLLQSQVITGILLWFVCFCGVGWIPNSAWLDVHSNKSRAAQPGDSCNVVVQAIFEALMAIVWIVWAYYAVFMPEQHS